MAGSDESGKHRGGWPWSGQARPPFAIAPGPGQESVWDYPRPPAVRPDPRLVEVRFGERRLASTRRAVRVLETASPPAFYIPPRDVDRAVLEPSPTRTFCEWKGEAHYLSLRTDGRLRADVGWFYPEPRHGYEAIAGYVAFYPERVECFLDGEPVRPQGGGFYGGWVTGEIVGPFKGEPGTAGW